MRVDLGFGRGDDTVGNPHRAQIVQFELFKPFLLLKLDELFPVEQFEATVSQSAVPSTPLNLWNTANSRQTEAEHVWHRLDYVDVFLTEA